MYRAYNAILLGLCVAAASCFLVSVYWLEPLAGDLTRLGGYSENDFGWNGAEEIFSPPLVEPGDAAKYYDIVLIGDSFSMRTSPDRQTRLGGFWTDFLSAGSGLSVGTFFIGKISPEDFIESAGYRAKPPRLLILEMVERTWNSFAKAGSSSCPTPAAAGFNLLQAPLAVSPSAIRRDTARRWSFESTGQMIDLLSKSIPRWAIGWDKTRVQRLPLSRSDLFSSHRPSEMLVYTDDFAKASWPEADWATMRCRLLRLQARIEADGRTRFLVVVVPDKSSAYSDYLPAAIRQPNAVMKLAEASALHLPRLDLELQRAIRAGVKDVYLPNDTHWGTTGSKIAADAVIGYIKNHPDVAASQPKAKPQSTAP